MSGTGGKGRNWILFACAAVMVAALAAPSGFGFSTGITTEKAGVADFEAFGCTACHGPSHVFAPLDNSAISYQIIAADGSFLNSRYTKDTVYTVAIRFAETNEPSATNHAGFNLRVSGGTLAGVDGQSQASSDGKQATHVGPTRTAWNVTWTAPAAGAVNFRLFINDVDGDGAMSATDQVREISFGLSDPDGATLGAPAVAEKPHYGIPLQQYWIGLIALAGMLFIIIAGYVYLKYGSKHNTDAKDR